MYKGSGLINFDGYYARSWRLAERAGRDAYVLTIRIMRMSASSSRSSIEIMETYLGRIIIPPPTTRLIQPACRTVSWCSARPRLRTR